MTPITIGAADDVLLALPAGAELAGEEDAGEELHPASARAATAMAGNPARTPIRRDRVIAALLCLAGPRWRVAAGIDLHI
jgi:hypothetical protein